MSETFERRLTRDWDDPAVIGIDGYLAKGGYEAFKNALNMEPSAIIDTVKASGLRGRGGAGFPTGMKWGFVPMDTGKPTYVVVNFDESEPGTCNNRELVERDPHRLLEGTAIAALAIGCRTAFIYVRGEYLCAGPDPREGDRRGVRRGVPRHGGCRERRRSRHRVAPGRGRLHLRRGDRAPELSRGLPGAAAAASAVPRGRGPLRVADRDQQRRDADVRAGHRRPRARVVPRAGHGEVTRHQAVHDLRQGRASGQLRAPARDAAPGAPGGRGRRECWTGVR